MMQKRWILKQADQDRVSDLAQNLKIPPLLALLLIHRGLSHPEAARSFFSSSLRSDLPSPFLMAGMEEAVERLVSALRSNEKICVWGDYDVDGTTGAAALVSFLRELGADPLYYIPHRIHEGYGLNPEGLRRLKASGAQLIVTVDCGISNAAEVEVARQLGIDIVIVDHHELPEKMPSAAAVINPHRHDCAFPDKGLSAAGLAFYLIIGLRAKLRELGWFGTGSAPDIRALLDIVALAAIADMVPLKGVNRVLTRRGLGELGGALRPGIRALKQVAGIPQGSVGAGQVAFRLSPRINAAGRMDAGLKVVEMLTTDSHEVALRIAQELDEHNRARQEVESWVLGEALSQIDGEKISKDRYSMVVASEGWHPGVLGIVASRIVERYHRPAVVIGFDQGRGKGSARSIRGFHMVDGLKKCAELLEGFGGHEFAGGLTIKKDKWPLFCERFEEIARAALSSEDLVPFIEVDAELSFSEIDMPLVRKLRDFEPFGIGNPEPLFMTGGVEVAEIREFNGGCRLRVRQANRTLGAVIFGFAPDPPLEKSAKLDLVYRLNENEWNGTSAAELRVVDTRPARG
ncbi:MAG: single-stranded-DNA-specific exonuclease RecJ [Deltaproteobacteria bacterium]|nr:single-stranded-DNA-specific exonuclease RecJ [Deltaproteobacteria bacterium]